MPPDEKNLSDQLLEAMQALDLHDFFAFLGLGFIVLGIWQWSATAGLISIGVMLLVCTYLDARARKKPRSGG